MGINYEKILSDSKEFKKDKELLQEIEYQEILFVISKVFVDYREKNNLTQKQLAEKLDVKQAMISKIESGKYNPSIKFLVYVWNKLSTEKFNFAEELLKRLYEKVSNNPAKKNNNFDENQKNKSNIYINYNKVKWG